MSASYRVTAPDRSGVVSAGSPDVIRECLRRENWPVSKYEITSVEAPFGSTPSRWGVAIKHPDGSVELIPDQPA
jgi:hypothetical protein